MTKGKTLNENPPVFQRLIEKYKSKKITYSKFKNTSIAWDGLVWKCEGKWENETIINKKIPTQSKMNGLVDFWTSHFDADHIICPYYNADGTCSLYVFEGKDLGVPR